MPKKRQGADQFNHAAATRRERGGKKGVREGERNKTGTPTLIRCLS